MNKKAGKPAKRTGLGRIMFIPEILAALVIIIGIGTMMSEDLRPNR